VYISISTHEETNELTSAVTISDNSLTIEMNLWLKTIVCQVNNAHHDVENPSPPLQLQQLKNAYVTAVYY
jgi:hypothetical protein